MNFGEYYTANSHLNRTTGCVVWDGEFSKSEPVAAGMKVRKVVYESVNGPQPYRTKFFMECENPSCVKAEHIVADVPEPTKHDYPPEKVKQVWEMYHDQGLRQDTIAEKLAINPSTVSKYLKHAKALRETPSEN